MLIFLKNLNANTKQYQTQTLPHQKNQLTPLKELLDLIALNVKMEGRIAILFQKRAAGKLPSRKVKNTKRKEIGQGRRRRQLSKKNSKIKRA